jgi:hypothetical protein
MLMTMRVRQVDIVVPVHNYVFDVLARPAPTHYYDIMARLEKRLRSRQAASR